MKTQEDHERLLRLVQAALLAALCYVGYAILPALSADGTKIHFGNAFVVMAAYLLGGGYGGLAGAVGLSLADILGGFAESAPRTFLSKLVIGLVVGLVAHRVAHLSEKHPAPYLFKWSALSAAAGLAANCVFEPALKYVWYTLLFPNPDKAAAAIQALLALTAYTTVVNAVINGAAAVVLYNAVRPALRRSGLLLPVGRKKQG